MTIKTLGILGGGQLGRMSAMAAEKLGILTVVFTPEENSPAAQVAYRTILADYINEAALQDFANLVDGISYEFENIPINTVQYLKTLKPVYPDNNLLEVSQDREFEKTFLNENKINTARWELYKSPLTVTECFEKWNSQEIIIKTARFGYDGKGQATLSHTDKNTNETLQKFNGQKLVIEEKVDFDCEISVIAARDMTGHIETYGPMRNVHKNHILNKTFFPADLPAAIAEQAVKITRNLAETIDLIGVLTLEMFVTKDGRLLANEIAPRTHNSGHWTIEGCEISQFENHVRAVCGLSVLPPRPKGKTTMINLIGDDVNDLDKYEQNPAAHTHLYGKKEARPGRKMGHVTILG